MSVIDPIVATWYGRSERERMLLIGLAVVVIAVGAWHGIASPLRNAAANAAMEQTRAAEILARVNASQRLIANSAGIARVIGKDLEEAVRASAMASGIGLNDMRTGSSNDVTVRMESIEPAAFFEWLGILQKAHGLMVMNMTATRNDDGSLKLEARLAGGVR